MQNQTPETRKMNTAEVILPDDKEQTEGAINSFFGAQRSINERIKQKE
jgi:hypothetical protein